MEISRDLIHQVFSLTPQDRYKLANHLLDSIDDGAAAELDQAFLAELARRREEMLRGDEIISDWRASLSAVENGLPPGN